MKTLLLRLHYVFIKPHVHERPIDNSWFSDTNIIVSQNIWQAFYADCRAYGVRVALINFEATVSNVYAAAKEKYV